MKADRMVDEVRAHFQTPVEIAVNHLYNHHYVARVDAFRKELIERAKGRDVAIPTALHWSDDDAWRRVLVARTREASDRGLITDGTARSLLELPAGELLPWERDVA